MKVFLIILLSVLSLIALILLLLCLLVKVRVIYDGSLTVKVGALCFFRTLVPKKQKLLNPAKEEKKKLKKQKKAEKKKRKKAEADKEKKAEAAKSKAVKPKASAGELFDFYTQLTREVFLPALERFGHKLHVKIKKMKIEIASEDAGKTAVLYGAAVAGGTAFLEMLRHAVKLKMGREKDICIVSRFDKTEASAEAELQVALRPLPTVLKLAPLFFKFISEKSAFDKRIAAKSAQPSKSVQGHKYPVNKEK